MSIKRRAHNDLNHDNWDQEDPEPEPMGTFKSASKEVLEKRVIRTAKKRTRTTFGGDEAKKNVFTGFGGFNKDPPSSFDFLSNLTNGNKTESDSTKAQTEASTTGSLFENNSNNKSWSSAAIPSTEGKSKLTFGMATTQSIFGSAIATSISNNLNSETTTSTPFKIQTTQVTVKSPEFPIKTPETNFVSTPKTSSIFGSNFQTSDTNKSIAGNSKSPKPQMTPNSTSNSTPATAPGISTNENKANNIKDEKKNIYYSKIKGLNESVAEWIYKHVKETPLCILTPIFKDYEKYLKDIQEEYEGANILQENKCDKTETSHSVEKNVSENKSEPKSSSSIFSPQTTSLFKNASNNPVSTGAVGSGFSFGITSSNSNSSPPLTSNTTNTPKSTSGNGSGFSFGIKSSENNISASNVSTPLTSNTTKDPKSSGADGSGFSFGIKSSENTISASNVSTPLTSNTTKDPKSSGADGSGFSFGIKSSENTISASNVSTPLTSNTTKDPKSSGADGSGFSFGIKTSSPNTLNTSTPLASNTSFSTGATGSSFSFSTKTSSVNTINTSNTSTPFASNTAMSTGATGSGFPFGINTSSTNTVSTSNASTPFSFTTNTTLSANSKMPFSFGSDKPFSFSSNVQKPVEKTENDKEEDDEPPKVEYTPVVEENSVFEKKCKIFVKKDDTFVDKGVGTLYIKKVEESGKHQLLVRANTNLGNVLLNLILSSAIPLQRTGKNNVMMVCIPNPDAKPPPIPVLVRVKTADDADELLEILNKYKS